jgi:hypothetical protein
MTSKNKRPKVILWLERGLATIPLAGIDISFHSRYLWSGVMPFRACEYFCFLLSLNLSDSSDLSSLPEGVYIPKLNRIAFRCQQSLCRTHLFPHIISTALESSSQLG